MSKAEAFLHRQEQMAHRIAASSTPGNAPSDDNSQEAGERMSDNQGVSSGKTNDPTLERTMALLQNHHSLNNVPPSSIESKQHRNAPFVEPKASFGNGRQGHCHSRHSSAVGGTIVVVGLLVLAGIWLMNMRGTVEDNDEYESPLTGTQIDDLVASRVVAVQTDKGGGSGIPLTKRDVLTNKHVVEDVGEGAIVAIYNEKWNNLIYGKVHKISSKADMAWLVMDEDIPVTPLVISRRKMKRGNTVYAYGYPVQAYVFGADRVMVHATPGQIMALDQPKDGAMNYQHSASINPGNSGGPLFNDHGEVVGINTFFLNGINDSYFAIEITELERIFGLLWDKVTFGE